MCVKLACGMSMYALVLGAPIRRGKEYLPGKGRNALLSCLFLKASILKQWEPQVGHDPIFQADKAMCIKG